MTRRLSRIRRAAAAAALAAVGAAVPAAPAAAEYRPSCSSGVYAPQVCTFVLSTVVARFAAAGQYAIVTPVRPSVAARSCRSGGTGWVEQYRGAARTVVEGQSVVGSVELTLFGCPDEEPTVTATAAYAGTGGRRGVWSTTQRYPYRTVTFSVQPGQPIPTTAFRDERNWGRYDGWMHHRAEGTLFRRDTGMSTYADGQTDYCEMRASNGSCADSNAYGAARLRVDSSVSGRWARLQVALDSFRDSEDATTRVTAQPYSSGWKVARV